MAVWLHVGLVVQRTVVPSPAVPKSFFYENKILKWSVYIFSYCN